LIISASRSPVSTTVASEVETIGSYSSCRRSRVYVSPSAVPRTTLSGFVKSLTAVLELGVDADVEVFADRLVRCLLEERREFLLGRRRDDRALDHDRVLAWGVGKHLADCTGAGPHRAQAVAAVCRDEVVEARLVDRCLAGVDGRDDRLVDVYVITE
jgi:hypothetical protein